MDSDTRQDKSIEILTKTAKFYFENKIKVCLFYSNKKYRHGFITELSSDFFMFNDRFDGLMPVFYIELDTIEKSKQGANNEM